MYRFDILKIVSTLTSNVLIERQALNFKIIKIVNKLYILLGQKYQFKRKLFVNSTSFQQLI